jgi:hypothetical protein
MQKCLTLLRNYCHTHINLYRFCRETYLSILYSYYDVFSVFQISLVLDMPHVQSHIRNLFSTYDIPKNGKMSAD